MKKGERRAVGFVLVAGLAVVALTTYLELQHQQHHAAPGHTPAGNHAPPPPAGGLGTRVIPKGLNPAALPAPDSRGATLLTLYCAQCHDLPTPLMHSAAEWPVIIDRMQAQIEARRGGMLARVIMPPEQDWQTLRRYVVEFAQKALDAARLDDLDTPAGQAFQRVCSPCHAAPAPSQHTAREWPRIVLRMKANMITADTTIPDVKTTELVVGYLQRHGG